MAVMAVQGQCLAGWRPEATRRIAGRVRRRTQGGPTGVVWPYYVQQYGFPAVETDGRT
jgi:hypothetical protein